MKSKLSVWLIVVGLAACSQEMTEPRDFDYYRAHKEESAQVIDWCKKTPRGDRSSAQEHNCTKASQAAMFPDKKMGEGVKRQAIKAGTLD